MSILNNYIRQPAVYTKLPCGKNWYKNNEIEFNLNDEVSILPMSHRDEILSHNADALFSSNAVVEIIKSCVPNVKDVKNILLPDVEVLLLAIKIASIDNEIEVSLLCPNCLEIYNNASNEEKEQLIKDKKISIQPQDFLFDAKLCLEQFLPKDDEYIYEFNNVKIHCKPLTLEESSRLDILNFEIRNAINIYIEESEKDNTLEQNLKDLADVNNWLKNKEKNDKLNSLLEKLDDIIIDTLVCSIKYVEVPEGIEENKENIKDFITKLPADTFIKIRNYINDINQSSLDKKITCHCEFCNHTWENDNLDFDISHFFAKSSSH